MEYLGGGTLDELNKSTRLSEKVCSFILREILRALHYMHQNLKIHRDIKPANILFDTNCGVKLADFGVAAQMVLPKIHRNTFVGTPLYLAPEIIVSEKYGVKVDIWSLGVMGIEIATGTVPRGNQHPMDILYAIPIDPPPQLPASFSTEFRHFISQCTVKDPTKRCSAQELLAHPFILQAETFDKSVLRKILEPRLKNSNCKKMDDSIPEYTLF